MAKVFIPVLRDRLAPMLNGSSEIKAYARKEAEAFFETKKQEMLNNFDEHDVTKELLKPTGESISGAIAGPPGANLFSFIGFSKSPISELRDLLRKLAYPLVSTGRVQKQRNGELAYSIDVNIPDNNDLYKETPFPGWNGGISWLKGIETYISGVHQYLTRLSVARNQSRRIFHISRSGQAIQIKGKLKQPAVFSPRPYITQILTDFKSKFRSKGGRFV